MYFTARTLDDLLAPVLQRLLEVRHIVSTSRGDTKELTGVLLRLRNPRARLSHTESKGRVFSCLGELLWYLAGSNKLSFIVYYIERYKKESEDNRTVYGAYGPRIFGKGSKAQVHNIIELLRRGPSTRRAVIQLFGAQDVEKRKVEVPCTCTLQFLLRRGRLHLITNMRSNDAYFGLPHDIFAFTMLQELVARSINVEVGDYKHAVGSLHLYKDHFDAAQAYLKEGWQTTQDPMPAMPAGDPWPYLKEVLKAERAIRGGHVSITRTEKMPDYWADMIRLLQIFRHAKNKESGEITLLRKKMSSKVYNSYILRREKPKTEISQPEKQMGFPYASDGDRSGL